MATIDASIPMGIKSPEIESPMNAMAKALQIQGLQNQNSLFPLQLAQQQLTNQRAQQQWQMVLPILQRMQGGASGGNALTAATGGASDAGGAAGGGGASAPAPNVMSQVLSGGGNPQGVPTDDGIPYSLQDLGALSMAGYPGAKEMLEVKKAAMQGAKFDKGSTYNVGGRVFTVPDIGPGMKMGPNGVEPLPNYIQSNAAIQGGQAAATEGAKLLPLDYKGADGRPLGGTQGEYVGANQPAAPQPAPASPSAAPQASSYQPPTVGLDGQPVPPQAQQQMALLAQSRDPAKLQQFAATVQSHIDAMPDPAQRQSASQQLQSEVGKIKQSWQTPAPQVAAVPPDAPLAPPPLRAATGRPQLQSPTEAATQAAAVKQATEPNLKYSTDAAAALAEENKSVGSQLGESQALMQRIAQSRLALQKFQAGGGSEARATLAQYAQAIPGMPASVVNAIAGGDLSAAQEFQKYAAQEALETMRQALASDNGKSSQGNRIAMQLFIKNNPNLTTDPNAIERIFNFQTQLHNELLNKSDMLTKYVSDPNTVKDPAVFNNLYAHSQIQSGNVNPQMVQGSAKGTTQSAATPAPQSQALTNTQGWRLHTDAQGNKAYVSPDGKQFQAVK